ncbi:PaaI family thioesterase [Paenisporosarcina indica]|uniref:PaaI family thioesterase n=1 Tax=Paenisporosarcina indica TaxID=650093 RepID=UPI00095010FC|nr:PaaI family thioesterase [Paenisporosarcina indica]
MKEQLHMQFQNLIEHSSDEDLSIIRDWMDGLEKKHSGEYTTYLSAGLHMDAMITEDTYTISIPITPLIHNSLNMPHGGIIAVILDTAMGTLATHSLSEEFAVVTTNLSINYIAVAKVGNLHAQAKFSHKGRQTMVVEGEVVDDQGKRIAIGTGSFFVIPRKRH